MDARARKHWLTDCKNRLTYAFRDEICRNPEERRK